VTQSEEHLTRDERRQRSEATILQAAREQFADAGFERTTIRSVAAAAAVDPALVMQHFGSKEGLFAAVGRQERSHAQVLQASLAEVPQAALDDLFADFEDPASRAGAIALMRSCLTHQGAADVLRDDVMCDIHAAVAGRIGGPDADLRASLLGATMIGLSISRYLLQLPTLSTADRADVERVLLPVLRALVSPQE